MGVTHSGSKGSGSPTDPGGVSTVQWCKWDWPWTGRQKGGVWWAARRKGIAGGKGIAGQDCWRALACGPTEMTCRSNRQG